METVSESLRGVFCVWSAGFGEIVFPKFVTLLLGAMLTTGRHTVVRVVGELADADPSSYGRVLSMRRWSMWTLARPLVVCLLDTFLPRGIVFLAGDETVTEHPGRKVFGKGRHRDAIVAFVCRTSVGTQVGGAGDPRETARRRASVGAAGVGRALPQREGQPSGRAAT